MQTRKQVLARDRAVTMGRIDSSGVYRSRMGRSALAAGECRVLQEDAFQEMIAFERKRSERSGKVYALVLVSTVDHIAPDHRDTLLEKTGQLLIALTRDTDVT